MSIETTAVLFILTGLLFIVLAVPMIRGKMKPNAWYGFRLPLTQKSDEIWYPANVYAGKWLVVMGVLLMAAAVLLPALFEMSVDAYAILMVIILLATLFVMFGFSYRYAKKLDAQLSASAKGADQS